MSDINKKRTLKEIIGRKVVCVLTKVSPTLSSKVIYKLHTKKKLNLNNPTLFNEKLMYLKLNDYRNNQLVIDCSDKIKVREYIKKCGYEHLLTEIYGIYEDANLINFKKLPNKFALKCNHGCGYNIICVDKKKLNINDVIKKLNNWKNTTFGYETCEPHYFKIKPLIYAEEYIITSDGLMPNDYKIYCFNGKPRIILVCSERESGLKLTFFDLEWNKLDYVIDKYKSDKVIKKPKKLKEMLEYATKLSQPFNFVRVDFYENNDGRVIFGELTFTPARCSAEYYNEKGNKELGDMLDLKK